MLMPLAEGRPSSSQQNSSRGLPEPSDSNPWPLGRLSQRSSKPDKSAVNQDLIRHEQIRRNSEFNTSGGFEFPDEIASAYIGMNGTNGGFAYR
jgi:hypothetical protein